MLEFIAERPFNANVRLHNIDDVIYILEAENNPISYFQMGASIWIRRNNHYDVYQLTESWDRVESITDFVQRIRQECE